MSVDSQALKRIELDSGDAARVAIKTYTEDLQYTGKEGRRIARTLLRVTGESLVQRRFSFWRWVQIAYIPQTSTELEFKQHFLPNGWGLDPKNSDPPPVWCEDDVMMLIVDSSLPKAVQDGGRRMLRQFYRDGWGFLRPTDMGSYEKLGHRWRMRLVQRQRRARKSLGMDDFSDLAELIQIDTALAAEPLENAAPSAEEIEEQNRWLFN